MYSGYSGHVYSGHFSWYKIHLFYYIQVRYSGQSDIVARKGWPKVATISEVHCILEFHLFLLFYIGECLYVHFKPKNRNAKGFPDNIECFFKITSLMRGNQHIYSTLPIALTRLLQHI